MCVKPITSEIFFSMDLDSPEQYEHCKGTNNTPVNTCHLHIIITEKSTPFIFRKIQYNAVPLHQRL